MSAPEKAVPAALDHAMLAVARGWRPFPVDHPAHTRCIGLTAQCREKDCNRDGRKRRGKHPVGKWATMAAQQQSDKMLAYWFAGGLTAPVNIGIACKPSGLVVLDEDVEGAVERLCADLGITLPPTYRVRTSRGWHYYFEAPAGVVIGNRSGRLEGYGIDVRGGSGDGGYVVGAGSVHASGVRYVAEDDSVLPAPFPLELIAEVQGSPEPAPDASAARLVAGPGGVNGSNGAATNGHHVNGSTGAFSERHQGGPGNWSDEVRFGRGEDLTAQYQRHLAAVHALAGQVNPGGSFRHALFLAALDGWRLIDLGLWPQQGIMEQLTAAVRAVWAADPDADDVQIVMVEARNRATASPWQLVGSAAGGAVDTTGSLAPPPSTGDPVTSGQASAQSSGTSSDSTVGPHSTASDQASCEKQEAGTQSDGSSNAVTVSDQGDVGDDAESDTGGSDASSEGVSEASAPPLLTGYEIEMLAEVRKQDVREDAKRYRKRRDRAERPSILDGLIDSNDLDELPDPEMLMAGLIPMGTVGILAGRFGTYKSFIAVSWAAAIASGRAWLDRNEFAIANSVPSLYVAAEGASGMKRRKAAWSKQFGSITRGRLTFYDRPVNFTDEDAVADLGAAIEARGFKFIVIDTLHRSAPGVDENDSTEMGVVLEAGAKLRDDHGCTVLYIDHTAANGQRPRGTTAKEDDTDFVLIAERDNDDTSAASQRWLKVHKLKDLPTDGRWPLRLVAVPEVESCYVEIGECGSAEGATSVFGGRTDKWWDIQVLDVPDAVVAVSRAGAGKVAVLDVFRVLAYIGGSSGLTKTGIFSLIQEGPIQHSRSSVFAALERLGEAGVTVSGNTPDRILLAQEFS